MPTNLTPTFAQSINTVVGGILAAERSLFVARVVHVVTGPTYPGSDRKDPYYKNPTDIGNIVYQILEGVQDRSQQGAGNPIAKPLFSFGKQMPIIDETVLLVKGPSTKTVNERGLQDYYYLPPYNVWNSSHHNAVPNAGDVSEFINKINRTYENSSGLNQPVNLSTSQSVAYPLSPSFAERPNIKALRPFAGDVTLEGRWGNSIRLGSTSAVPGTNPWSADSPVGNPITIIRNGQGRQLDDTAWVPTVEDINRDPSSIYLTQGQKIVIDDVFNNFTLTTLDVSFERTITAAIPIQEQVASYDSISPSDQDKRLIG